MPELGLPAAVWIAITLGIVEVLALVGVIVYQAFF